LVARIGLDSGPVVVDATGEVFGDAPNVAARAQGAAEPGIVLVTANVQRQIAGLFVAEDKGRSCRCGDFAEAQPTAWHGTICCDLSHLLELGAGPSRR
jgi:class 3 adenylate cyclase